MGKILNRIKNKLYNFMPISRAEHKIALKNIAEIIDGLSLADEQHGQIVMNMLKEQEQLKMQIATLTNGKNSSNTQNGNGNGVNKSYA